MAINKDIILLDTDKTKLYPLAHKDSGNNVIVNTYVKKAGDTMTGPLIIEGTADSNPLIVRGISGSDGNGNLGDLFLNRNGGVTYFGTAGGGYISADGKSYSGNAATATKATQDGDGNTISTTYVKEAGDTMTGSLSFSNADIGVQRVGRSKSWHKGRDGALVKATSLSGYSPTISTKTNNGSWEIGAYDSSNYTDDLVFSYVKDTDYTNNTNAHTEIKFLENGGIVANLQGNVTGNVTGSSSLNVLKAGDTMTGPLIITGNASSNPLTTRGIRGSNGSGGEGDLYINYSGGGVTYFGTNGGGNISADGKSYSGNSATASGVIDAGDSSKTITMQYSGSGITSASWFGAWSGYKLTCISAANAWTALGGGSIGKKSSLSASDIPSLSTDKLTSGTLPIARGGTGASSAASARTNLATPYMTTEDYPALLPIDGTNNWIKVGTKNTSFGLLPSQAGGAGSGHNYLGTGSWYWKYAYIDEIYGVLKKESSATGVITKVSGAWTVNSSSVTVVAGRICQLWVKLKGSGTSVAKGNNAFRGTLSTGYRPLVQQNTCQYYSDTGFLCYLGTDGDFVVRVIASDRTIPSDEYNEFTFTYLI